MSSTQFDGDIDSFVSYLKSNRGLSANTLKAYRADLTACLHLFELRGVTDLNEITLDDLRSWMAVESRDHARSSMARKTVAVRGFFAWAYEHGVTNTDPAATLMTPSIPSTLPRCSPNLKPSNYWMSPNRPLQQTSTRAMGERQPRPAVAAARQSARQLISQPTP